MASDSIRALRVKTLHAANGESGFAQKRFDKLTMSVSANYIAGDGAWPYLYVTVIINSSLDEVIGLALQGNVGDVVREGLSQVFNESSPTAWQAILFSISLKQSSVNPNA
ncbi:MAG: hypothetical protein ACXV8U_20040 [Methylobacter sp.]